MSVPNDILTEIEEADVTKIFKGAMCTNPIEGALGLLNLGSAYFGWGTPHPFTSNDAFFMPNGGFYNLYDSEPTVSQIQDYASHAGARKLFLIGTNEHDLSIPNDENWSSNADIAAADEAELWKRQRRTLITAYAPATPLIYVAGGSQIHANNNPGGTLLNGQNSEHYPLWISKVWSHLNSDEKADITGFHIHYYPGADRYTTDPTSFPHRNPHPQWARDSIGYRLQDWYNWFSQSSDRAGKKIILSETGASQDFAPPPGVNLPRRIHRACRDQNVKRWFWYGYVLCPPGAGPYYVPLTQQQSGSYALTPTGLQFQPITPTTT